MNRFRIVVRFSVGLVCLLFLAVFQTTPNLATAASHKQIGLRSGFQHYQFKDLILNPTRYDNRILGSPALEIYYKNTTPTSIFRGSLNGDLVYGLSNRFDDGTWSWAMHPNLNLTYAKKWRELSEHITWYLGGDLGSGFHFAEIPLWDDTHYYWLTYHSLNIRNLFDVNWASGKSLQIEIALPLIALVSRPPAHYDYLGDDTVSLSLVNQDLQLTSLHAYQMLDVRLEFFSPIASRWDLAVAYRMKYFHCETTGSKSISILENGILVGIDFRL